MPRQYIPRVSLVCAQCGRDFDVPAYRGAVARFCSRECFGASCIVIHSGEKRCNRCGETKPVGEFSPHPSRHAGAVASYCRPCMTASLQLWREANPRRFIEQRKGWGRRNPERRRIVMRAITRVQRALKSGDLVRLAYCEECGANGRSITAAHHDYSRPLDVRWLCRPCHSRWDRADPKTLHPTDA